MQYTAVSHGHWRYVPWYCFLYCMLWTTICHEQCHVVPWALLYAMDTVALYVIFYVLQHVFAVRTTSYNYVICCVLLHVCVIGIAVLCRGQCFLHILYAMYILPQVYVMSTVALYVAYYVMTHVCAMHTAALYIARCVLPHVLCHWHCLFMPWVLLLYIVCCVQLHALCYGHSCFVRT